MSFLGDTERQARKKGEDAYFYRQRDERANPYDRHSFNFDEERRARAWEEGRREEERRAERKREEREAEEREEKRIRAWEEQRRREAAQRRLDEEEQARADEALCDWEREEEARLIAEEEHGRNSTEANQ